MIITISPKAVDFWDNTGKLSASRIKKAGNYDLVFNASYFNMGDFTACYATKCNGKVLSNVIYPASTYGYGWNDGEIPRVMKAADALNDPKINNFLSAVWAVLDGKPYTLDMPTTTDPAVMRTYMGMKANKDMVIGCEVISMKAAQQKLISMGCVSGLMLDGGGSSQLITDTDAIVSQRIVKTLVCVKLKPETSKLNIIDRGLRFAYNSGNRSMTTHCIIHHAAADGAVEIIHNYHLSQGWAGIGYHYYVRKDGTIYRGRPEAWIGGHTINYNYRAIGICFEGNFESEYMSDAQLEAGQALVADIKKRYPGITIGGHREFNSTACPGKNFPLTMLINPVDGTPEDEMPTSPEPDNPSEWAKDAWEWAKSQGITDGSRPQDTATREEIITMLWRAIK